MERRDHGGAESHNTSQPKIESPADHFVPSTLGKIRGPNRNASLAALQTAQT
jgi:hypothetical protein